MSPALPFVSHKKTFLKSSTLLCVLCLLALCSHLYANLIFLGNSGDFIFYDDTLKNTVKIKVYYHAPKKLLKNSQIVFVLHGDSRNAAKYRDEWKRYAEKYNFLLLCPELTKREFPYWKYNCGNIFDYKKKSYNPKEKWTFNIIENLFDIVKNDRRMTTDSYCIFGHSSGAQVVQRMVLFMPDARFSVAIANGGGWHTIPRFKHNFTYGIKNSPLTQESLKKSFEKNLIILMGSKDFVSKKSPGSYAKATHKWDRLWRSRFFYKDAKSKSDELGAQFNWTFRLVRNADHNNPRHALIASQIIAASRRRNNAANKTQTTH